MGIHLSTEAIVISIYGGTKWTNISDKFLIGASSTYKVNATGGTSSITSVPTHSHSYTPSGTVSSHTHTGPSHTHNYTPSGTVSNHNHEWNPGYTETSSDGNHYHDVLDRSIDIGAGAGYTAPVYNSYGSTFDLNTGYAGSHVHYLYPKGSIGYTQPSFSGTRTTTESAGTGNTGSSQPSFTGTASNTGNTGNSSVSVLNPYYAVYIWIRTE